MRTQRFHLIALVLFLVVTCAGVARGAGLSNTKDDQPAPPAPSSVPVVDTAEDAESVGGVLPDILEEIPNHLGIQNTQQREWLRFSTTHWNIGEGNLQIRGGGQVDSCVIEGEAYEQCTVASQEILNANGEMLIVLDRSVC